MRNKTFTSSISVGFWKVKLGSWGDNKKIDMQLMTVFTTWRAVKHNIWLRGEHSITHAHVLVHLDSHMWRPWLHRLFINVKSWRGKVSANARWQQQTFSLPIYVLMMVIDENATHQISFLYPSIWKYVMMHNYVIYYHSFNVENIRQNNHTYIVKRFSNSWT